MRKVDLMAEIDFISVLNQIIEDYTSRGLSALVPTFMMENDEIGAYLDDSDAVDTYTDGIIYLESVVETETIFQVQDWTIEYDFVKDLWIFTKKLDFKRIVVDSHNRKQIVKQQIVARLTGMGPRNLKHY